MIFAAVDWGAVGTFAGVALVVLGGVAKIATQLSRIEEQSRSQHANITQNARHVDAVMATMWPTIWRVSSLEDFLEAEMSYHPPKLLPSMPQGDDEWRQGT